MCTQVEGVVEVLGPLADQQTVPVESPQLIADKVVRILTAPSLALELGAANRRRVAQQYSLQAMVEQYAALYSEVSRDG